MSKIAEQPFHIRSNSMPSTSHPTIQRVGEALQQQGTNVPSSITTKVLCDGLRSLGVFYELIDELIFLPTNQQSLHPSQKKLVEQQIDESLKFLDLIGDMKDCIVAMREHVRDLHSALRRKGNGAISTKNMHKLLKKCRRTSKQMNYKSIYYPVVEKDGYMLVKALEEARMRSISLLQSVISFLSKPKQKGSRWSILSKGRVACEGELEGTIEEESVSIFLQASYDCITCNDVDTMKVLKAQNLLESLEIKLESIESGLDCLFRRLITNRVSLLNLLDL